MSELRVDNIVSENGTAPPIYSKGLRIGSGQTLTNNGDYFVDGSTTLNGPTIINSSVNITNTGVTTVAGTFNVDGAGQSTIAGDVEVTGALNVLGGGTLNTTGIITVSDLNVTNSFSYQNLAVSGVSTFALLEVTGFGTFSDIYVSGIGSFNSIGIGTTSPDAAIHVVDNILVSAGAAATLDIRIKAYDDELGAISFEDAVDATQYFSISKDRSEILFGVNDANFDTMFVVDASGNVGIQTDTVGASRALDVIGNVVISGSITKGSGTFTIPHPIDSSKLLVHSFIEGPKADLIYRGKSQLSNGISTIAMDSHVGLITGTWESLCRNPQVFVQNNESFSLVKASITKDGILTITSNENINHEIDWMVIAERDDKVIKDAQWTDNDGNPILEPNK